MIPHYLPCVRPPPPEIILIIWGIIFISNQRQPPDLKGRNFVKSARRVLKLGRSKEDSASNATVTEENVPSWESESRIGSSTERFSPVSLIYSGVGLEAHANPL